MNSAQMSLRTGWFWAFMTYPTGCCIHELAAMMNAADPIDAAATNQMQARCTFFDSRSHPKIHRPRKVDSTKKAARPSMASGPPNTLPTSRE